MAQSRQNIDYIKIELAISQLMASMKETDSILLTTISPDVRKKIISLLNAYPYDMNYFYKKKEFTIIDNYHEQLIELFPNYINAAIQYYFQKKPTDLRSYVDYAYAFRQDPGLMISLQKKNTYLYEGGLDDFSAAKKIFESRLGDILNAEQLYQIDQKYKQEKAYADIQFDVRVQDKINKFAKTNYPVAELAAKLCKMVNDNIHAKVQLIEKDVIFIKAMIDSALAKNNTQIQELHSNLGLDPDIRNLLVIFNSIKIYLKRDELTKQSMRAYPSNLAVGLLAIVKEELEATDPLSKVTLSDINKLPAAQKIFQASQRLKEVLRLSEMPDINLNKKSHLSDNPSNNAIMEKFVKQEISNKRSLKPEHELAKHLKALQVEARRSNDNEQFTMVGQIKNLMKEAHGYQFYQEHYLRAQDQEVRRKPKVK